jgi:tetratricopeptide (TPR) repeat protein
VEWNLQRHTTTQLLFFQESLKVRTLEDFPMDYATTQNNLGNAYQTLAEVEDKAGNCKKAIQAFKEALSVYTKEEFPEVYRIIEKNIKNVYVL